MICDKLLDSQSFQIALHSIVKHQKICYTVCFLLENSLNVTPLVL